MPRVCVIRCHYFRDTRLQREVDALLDRGHSVHVVCLREEGEPLREHRGRLTISRMPLRHHAGAGTARRLAEYAAFLAVVGLGVAALHLRHRFDLVQVNSPPDVLVFTALIPKLTGARVLLDLQEPLPEFFAMKSGAGEGHPAVRLVAACEQASIRFAHAALTVTEQMRQAFVGRGAAPDKITVVMDGSDANLFDPTRFPPRERREEKFVLVSHGTIEPQYGLDTAIRAVARLAAAIPTLELVIVGDGSQRCELQALSSSLGVSDRIVFSAGFLPIDELVATLANSDVGVVAMKKDPFRDLTLAGKMFDFITMGIPMVVSTTRSVEETFPVGCFEPFVAGDPTSLARAVEHLYHEPELAASYAIRAKHVARPYLWPMQCQRYSDVVDGLLDLASVAASPKVHAYSAIRSGSAPISVELTRQPDTSVLAGWDELVEAVPDSDVAQLSAWAGIRRAAGFEPMYVFAWRAGKLVGGALVLWRRLPLVGQVGYVPYGPIVAPEADRASVVAALAVALHDLAVQRMRMLFIQPPAGGDDISRELRRLGFRQSHAGIAPEASLRLDLSDDEDSLWSRLPKETRRRGRKWADRGVSVRRGTLDDVKLLARLHAATAQHHGFDPIPVGYMANLYSRLAPAGHAELFVGELNGRSVVADLLTGCGGVLTGRLTGMERDSAVRRLAISSAVRWEEIRWAKANGYRWLDFGGIREAAVSILLDPRPDTSKLTSSEAFKVSFGGTPFRYPMPVEMISSRMVRCTYDLTQRWPAGRRLVERTSHQLRAGASSGFRPIRRSTDTSMSRPAR